MLLSGRGLPGLHESRGSASPNGTRGRTGASRSARSHDPEGLAYVGDAAWEVKAREREYGRNGGRARVSEMRARVEANVKAEAQARAMERLREGGHLSKEEEEVARRGRNASGARPSRLRGKEGARVYREASGLEALAGFLLLEGRHDRLEALATLANI